MNYMLTITGIHLANANDTLQLNLPCMNALWGMRIAGDNAGFAALTDSVQVGKYDEDADKDDLTPKAMVDHLCVTIPYDKNAPLLFRMCRHAVPIKKIVLQGIATGTSCIFRSYRAVLVDVAVRPVDLPFLAPQAAANQVEGATVYQKKIMGMTLDFHCANFGMGVEEHLSAECVASCTVAFDALAQTVDPNFEKIYDAM